MNSQKYSRLPTSDPGPEFSALDGPSFFSYEIERKKYGSAFSYTGTPVTAESNKLGKLEVSRGYNYSMVQFSIDCVVNHG